MLGCLQRACSTLSTANALVKLRDKISDWIEENYREPLYPCPEDAKKFREDTYDRFALRVEKDMTGLWSQRFGELRWRCNGNIANRGIIECYPEPGMGSTFEIRKHRTKAAVLACVVSCPKRPQNHRFWEFRDPLDFFGILNSLHGMLGSVAACALSICFCLRLPN